MAGDRIGVQARAHTRGRWLACAVLAWAVWGVTPAMARSAKAKTDGGAAMAVDTAAIRVQPLPSWVEPVTPEEAPADSPAPMFYALLDKQVRVGADGVSSYEHLVKVMRQPSGVEAGSQIQIEYDPSYQTLVMHEMVIWRNGKRIDKLKPAAFKILHRETQLERLIYDGRATASLVLDDVRVGDRIEYAFTLQGQNPVFGGKFVELDWGVSSTAPVGRYRLRLLYPAQRQIHRKLREDVFKVTERNVGDQHEVVVERHQAPQWGFDATVPASAFLSDAIQWSEYADWADVARWAQGLFASAIETHGPVQEQAQQLTSAATSDEDRVRRTLDFVQSGVRYFGTEIGANSHLPAPAQVVLKQRYGDCKDKAALLVSMLRAQGIQADPVLVSTTYRDGVSDMLPSPLAFDHAIAEVKLGDRVYWLDGTRGRQSGALPYRNSEGLGLVLPAVTGQAVLVATPDATRVLRAEGHDVFHFKSLADAPELHSAVTYHGELAELWRQVLANQSPAELQKSMLTNYVRFYPGLTVSEPMKVVDDPEHNALTLQMTYQAKDYLRFPQQRGLVGDYALLIMVEPLQLPSQAPRTRPLRLSFPGIYRHTVEYQFDQDIFDVPASNHVDDNSEFFTVHVDYDGAARSYRISGELQQLTPVIDAADWSKYKEALTKTWPHLGSVMILPPLSSSQLDRLKRDIQTFNEDYKRGRLDIKSQVQAQSTVKVMALKAILQADRLPPKLRQQVLVELAGSQDLVGQFDWAERNFRDALVLDRQSATAHSGLAVNLTMQGHYAQAESEADTALQLDPNDHSTRLIRAQSLYYQRKYPQARDELLTLLKNRSEVERSYAALWLYLTERRMGEDAIAAVKPYLPTGLHPAWPYPVLQMYVGALDFGHAQDVAKEGDKVDQGKLCELYYYRGMQELIGGDGGSARTSFRKSMDTGIVEFMEYGFAKRELFLMQ